MQNLETLSQAELIALVGRMQAQSRRKLTLKVSEKGAVSMYGTGRFPVTLYAETWERVLSEADTIRQFIADNRSLLSQGKDDARFAKAEA